MPTKPKTRVIITAAVIVAILVFIFSNSFENPAESAEKSGKIYELIVKIMGENAPTHEVVRKIAHFAEYSILGASLAVLTSIFKLKPVLSLLIGALSAIADETIQIFSGRGSSVADVWLDIAGVLFGGAVTIVIILLISDFKAKSQNGEIKD